MLSSEGLMPHRIKRQILDVCDCIDVKARDKAVVRGTAQFTRDGLVLFDSTCPSAVTDKDRLPMLVLIDISGFFSETDQRLFNKKRSMPRPTAFFQVVAEGDLKCQVNFVYELADDGDLVQGNGFGSYGLIKCKVEKAKVLQFHELE